MKAVQVLLSAMTVVVVAHRLDNLGVVDLSLGNIEATVKGLAPPSLHPVVDRIRQHIEETFRVNRCGWLAPDDYFVVSSRVVTPSGELPAAVQVVDGSIVKIIALDERVVHDAEALKQVLGTDLSIMSYGSNVVAPGLIDVHTHMNEPGRETWEGIRTGTASAAAGGITLVVDMPLNSAPAMTTPELVDAKINATNGKLYSNMAMWGGLVPDNAHSPQVLESMAKKGVMGFKCFLSPSGINDFPNSSVEDVAAALPTLHKLDLPVMVHAELVDDVLEPQGDPTEYATYMATRPPSWEQNAIRGLLDALASHIEAHGPTTKRAAGGGFGLHIAHLADAGSLEMIQDAKARGLPVTVETCTHYLNFAAEEIPKGDTRYKCAPPLRSVANREQLWEAVVSGKLDIISTDHSPAPPELKQVETGDFITAWGGIAGLQYGLPGTWHGMARRGMTPGDLTKFWSTNPARLLGLTPTMGEIAPGKRADLVVWEPKELADTSTAGLHHKHKLTPYQDLALYGRVKATFVGGRQVYNEKQGLFSSKACGALILHSTD